MALCNASQGYRASRFASNPRRFSSSHLNMSDKLRIGYVPEHFSTPLHYAQDKFGLKEHAELIPYPAGTGTMVEAFHGNHIDVGIGLTEAWIVGLSKAHTNNRPYKLLGAYTLSPLLWAISTGSSRDDIASSDNLRGRKVGISRIGSGSHIMSIVLAHNRGWLTQGSQPFDNVVCGPFKPLREAVNDGRADFFMWEHFTTKRYWDNGELKRIGQIETPWKAWHIAVNHDPRIRNVFVPALAKGVQYFQRNKQESIDFISRTMEYSKEDAEAWYDGVVFAEEEALTNLDEEAMGHALEVLGMAGVLGASIGVSELRK